MPVWMTQSEYARHRGVSKQAVNKAVRVGRAMLIDGKLDRDAADALWRGHGSPQMAPGSLAGGRGQLRGTAPEQASNAVTYAQSRAVREAWQARLARLEYEERAGILLKLDEVRIATFNKDRRVRDLLLALPDRVTPLLAATPEDAPRIYATLQEEVHRALNELADEFSRGTGAGNGSGGVSPANAADGRAVG